MSLGRLTLFTAVVHNGSLLLLAHADKVKSSLNKDIYLFNIYVSFLKIEMSKILARKNLFCFFPEFSHSNIWRVFPDCHMR